MGARAGTRVVAILSQIGYSTKKPEKLGEHISDASIRQVLHRGGQKQLVRSLMVALICFSSISFATVAAQQARERVKGVANFGRVTPPISAAARLPKRD